MNAFVINHFGNNIKYFKYELYFLYMLRNNTKNDIIYLYSQNDTPYIYIEIIKLLKLNIKPIGYDDKKITYNINFKSSYKVFNLLRTCNYIFAYKLIEYEKICIVESDMIITENIDSIFELKTPSILYYRLNDNQLNKNLQIKLKNSDIKYIINKCSEESFTNGGVILFKPSLSPIDTVVFPSPAGVGVNAVTSIKLLLATLSSSIRLSGNLALYLPYCSKSSAFIFNLAAMVFICCISTFWAMSKSVILF